MRKIDMNKPGGKGEEPVRKTISEVTEELQARLKNQGIIADSSFLSSNFKTLQKEPFPYGRISGTISIGNEEVNAFISVAGSEDESVLKGRLLINQFKIEKGNIAEALKKATAALNLMLESFYVNTADEKQKTKEQEQQKQQEPQKQEQQKQENAGSENQGAIVQSTDPKEVAASIQQALQNPEVANEFNKLKGNEEQAQQKEQETPVKTVTISTGAKALNDEKIVNHYSNPAVYKSAETNEGSEAAVTDSSLKNQLINVNFTPEQAEVVMQLLEENQKRYEPKSTMFGLLGEIVGKMLTAFSNKLDQLIDTEKKTHDKLNSIYKAINDENFDLFAERYKSLEQKIKYCHDIVCEAAQGESIQSTNIIDHILNKEKVPVSIRTLHNAFVTAIDNNIESALSIYKYADANLHGEAHFDTIRGFLSHGLNTLSDKDAERFINVSSIRAFDDSIIFKEMIRAGRYELLNTSLQRCESINDHAPSLYYFAAQRKDADALHILASKGANVNDNSGEALYTCFETNKLETAKVLINYGADVNLLRDRLKMINTMSPNYKLSQNNVQFLDQLYKYCGLGGLQQSLNNQSNEHQEEVEVYGDNGDLDAQDIG